MASSQEAIELGTRSRSIGTMQPRFVDEQLRGPPQLEVVGVEDCHGATG